jgi:hydroxypyruvate reductase
VTARAPSAPARTLLSVFETIARACDGRQLVARALASTPVVRATAPFAVLALGKVAGPMLAGLRDVVPDGRLGEGLVITTAASASPLPPRFRWLTADHPRPGPASLRAGEAAHAFISARPPRQPLLVLLSGGGSALACLPAAGITLADKAAVTAAVMAGGASVHELNAVRKHLSALKGGRLGVAARGPVLVLALSDVVGDDPGTIASGPFSYDNTSFGDALAVLQRFAPRLPGGAPLPPSVRDHLEAGAAGRHPETPKPGTSALDHVDYRVIAGPEHVVDAAMAAGQAQGLAPAVLLRDTEEDVASVAAAFLRASETAGGGARARIYIANGEPRIAVPARPGTGGRATHLALLVARAIAGRPLAFLAAGTDDRDGNGAASGAVVDGTTWAAARAAGLDPQAALDGFDSATLLGALGCLVRGPGTSNLLDVMLLLADGRG